MLSAKFSPVIKQMMSIPQIASTVSTSSALLNILIDMENKLSQMKAILNAKPAPVKAIKNVGNIANVSDISTFFRPVLILNCRF